METLYVVFSLNAQRGSMEETSPHRGFFTVLLVLADLGPDEKYSFFLGVKNVKSVSRSWGQNNGN